MWKLQAYDAVLLEYLDLQGELPTEFPDEAAARRGAVRWLDELRRRVPTVPPQDLEEEEAQSYLYLVAPSGARIRFEG